MVLEVAASSASTIHLLGKCNVLHEFVAIGLPGLVSESSGTATSRTADLHYHGRRLILAPTLSAVVAATPL